MPTWKKYATTDLATAAAPGLCPTLSDVATEYLNGDGAWAVPAGGGATIVLKTADESCISDASLNNDTHLLLAVETNTKWAVTFLLFFLQGASATAEYDIAIVGPDGSSGVYGGFESGNANNKILLGTATLGTEIRCDTGSGESGIFVFKAIIIIGATAGNIQLQWAQGVSAAVNTTIKAGSCLIAHKLA